MLGDATLCPAVGALDRVLLVAARVHERRELVECEHDVGAELVLDVHRNLGGESVQRAVERRLERDAVLVHERHALLAFGNHVVGLHALHIHRQRLLEARAERKHLESTGVGESRAVPVHELRETARLVKHVLTGALVQVERVRQQTLCAELGHRFRQHGLHCTLRGHRHECRRLDVAVWRVQNAGATIAGAAFALAVRGIRQSRGLFKTEGAAVAGFARFSAARMLHQLRGRCLHLPMLPPVAYAPTVCVALMRKHVRHQSGQVGAATAE